MLLDDVAVVDDGSGLFTAGDAPHKASAN